MITVASPSVVTAEAQSVRVVVAGTQGARGPVGPVGPVGPAGGAGFTRTAGETLGAHRAVFTVDGNVYYCDHTVEQSVLLYLGLTLNSAVLNEPVTVLRAGELEDPSFTFTAGPIYMGLDGMLTQTIPETGYAFQLGYAESATKIVLDPQIPVQRE